MAGAASFQTAGPQLLQRLGRPARRQAGSSPACRTRGPIRVRGTAAPEAPASQQAAAEAQTPFGARDLQNFLQGYKSQYVEHAYWVEEGMVEGTIPPELSGTLLRNGPGLFEVGDQPIPQPFDGDGQAVLFSFRDGRAFFANRFIRTEAFVKEQQAGKMVFRGAFSTGAPEGQWFFNPFDFSIKKVANTGIFHWGGKTLALYERDLPYELEGPDLRTKGRTDLGGAIGADSPWIAAHYRKSQEDDGSERWVAFSAGEAGGDARVRFWEFGADLGVLHRTERLLPGAAFGFFHDMAMTQEHYLLLENPVRMDYRKLLTEYMLGKSCLAECLKYNPAQPTRIHVIPRPGRGKPSGPDDVRTFETSPFFAFHHGNAFVAPDGGSIVVDTVALHEGMNFDINFDRIDPGYYEQDVGRGTLTRLVLHLADGKVSQQRLMERACEFPCVAPPVVGRPHTHTYCVAARQDGSDSHARWGAPQLLCKVTVDPAAGLPGAPGSAAAVVQDIYNPGPDRFAQEPIFVPRPGAEAEDDGWVMALVYDAATDLTELAILDAASLAAGPVARIKLPHMLPFGLHGSWTDAYLGPDPGAPFAPVEYDIRRGVPQYE